MPWKKLGQIFNVKGNHPKLISHAANPLAMHLHDNIFRVFYSGRDLENRSSVSYADIDILELKCVHEKLEPIFEYGPEGSFYSHGVSIGNMYTEGDKQYILFMGWQIPEKKHWRGDIGKLRLIENSRLELVGTGPFMGMDEEDPVSLSYPWVMNSKGEFKMWYGSTIEWHTEHGEMLHVIKYATSSDGENWMKHGLAIPYELGIAQAFSRPSVLLDKQGYHMWYSYRDGKGTKYRIGYAQSKDGLTWENKFPETGIDVSPTGWDSEMICYPFVFGHNDKRYMLYNGNEHGKTGFGIAIFE